MLFNVFAKFSQKLTFLPHPPVRTRACAYQGIRNVSFPENFPDHEMNDPLLTCEPA